MGFIPCDQIPIDTQYLDSPSCYGPSLVGHLVFTIATLFVVAVSTVTMSLSIVIGKRITPESNSRSQRVFWRGTTAWSYVGGAFITVLMLPWRELAISGIAGWLVIGPLVLGFMWMYAKGWTM